MRLLINVTLATDERMEVCAEAANATDAVIQATKFQPELVILDHFIEGDVMGLQAAPLIKQAAPDAKILMFTSHDLSAEVRRDDAVYAYDSAKNTVTTRTLPASGEQESVLTATTPQEAAQAALSAVGTTTDVRVDRTARVAGRSAYQLVLRPEEKKNKPFFLQLQLFNHQRYFLEKLKYLIQRCEAQR